MNSNSSQQDDVNSSYDDLISEGEMFMADEFFGENNESEPDDVIIVHMDIREPLRLLKTLLEEKIGVKLTEYTICLQEAQTLEPHKNLVDQCVRGEGLVQINSQVQTINKRINIVDVLKPSEDILEALTDNKSEVLALEDMIIEENHCSEPVDSKEHEDVNINKRFHNWAMDQKFKKEQARLNIPRDPALWTVPQVKHWLLYAVRQFNLKHIKLSNWNITGAELCAMTNAEFNVKVPYDPGNTFWTHLELLRQFKNVTTVTVARNNDCQQINNDQTKDNQQVPNNQVARVLPKIIRKSNSVSTANNSSSANECTSSGHMNVTYASSNNGQVQLWQFLLDILTDKTCTDIIQWLGGEGEFKLLDPERVAQLWGEKKNKPTMNYEKLSRALRYYYDGDMISKVPGKRFVYKFDCDLKLLIGYDALQLSRLVNESTQVVQFC